MYYGIEYPQGVNVNEEVYKIYAFPTIKARNHWAWQGPDYFTLPGYRERIAARDPKVRLARKHDEVLTPGVDE